MYEDEYDDTYEAVKMSANDLDDAEDLAAIRLRAQQIIKREESSEDSEDQE